MTRDDSRALSIGSFAVAVVAMFFAGALLLTRDDDKTSAAPGETTTVEVVAVTLKDMQIVPAELHLPPTGARLQITNEGPSAHTLIIDGGIAETEVIAPGTTITVTVPPVSEGTYEMWCTVAGHKEAGMTGIALVGAALTDGTATSNGHTLTNEEMDAAMLAVAQQFPAKTEGIGGKRLEPTILADGTKQYDITAKIVQWEVTPGKFVEAYTYNGVVPAPEMKVNVGDKVRINFKNELPESTTIHWHGVRVPNSMDGVDPYTQAPVLPGGTFVYEFTALEKAVGIYHSHHDAQKQVPNGLFGAFMIGDYEIPEILKDRGFTTIDKTVNMVLNDAGTIGLTLNGKGFPATEPYTLKLGETMMVHYFNEGLMGHPMHLHQPSGWIIAKDGVDMIVPIPGDTIWIGPGERYTVVYKAVDPGVWAWHCHILSHAEGPTGMFGMVTALIVEQ